MKKRLFLLFSFGIVLSGLTAFLFYKYYFCSNQPSEKEFPIRGIDISHHQGKINWDELKKEKLSFVFIKASEGGDFKDPDFSSNWKNAKAAGLKTGAYHFYRLCKTGAEQAANFIASVPKENGNLPPVIDLESEGNCPTTKTKSEQIAEIDSCIQKLKIYYGQEPVIYTTALFYKNYCIGHFQSSPIWIRDIQTKPSLPDARAWTFWQYSSCGNISGIDGDTDENVFCGDRVAFEKLLSR